MKDKILRALSGILGLFLMVSVISLAQSNHSKDIFDLSTYLGGMLLGITFLVYGVKGKSLVDKS